MAAPGPQRRRMPAPWWASAILALAWLLISDRAQSQEKADAFKVKYTCAIKAWVGTKTKRAEFKVHPRRLASSEALAMVPVEPGLVVTITGVRGWWMIATEIHDARGKRLFKGTGWVWSRLLVQRLEGTTPIRRKPEEDSGTLIEAPDDTRVQLRGCRDGWSLVGWRHKRGWVAPDHQCPRKGAACRYEGKPE